MRLHYDVPCDDLSLAGRASTEVKKVLARLGIDSAIIKRTAVAMYEAEINMVIHANGGTAEVEISPESILVTMEDTGPGIPDLELAMSEGYSTAPQHAREMGFGAGLGLPNMKRNSDELGIESVVGKGTTVKFLIKLKQ